MNQNGQSLVELMVSAVCAIIFSFVIFSFHNFMNKQNNAVVESVAILDLEREMIPLLANGTTCDAIVTANPTPFDASAISATQPYVFTVPQIPSIGGGSAIL